MTDSSPTKRAASAGQMDSLSRVRQHVPALGGDTRGVTPLIGFILLFGILVAAFTIVQTQVVPLQNQEVEADHNQAVQSDMADLRAAILNTEVANQRRGTTSVQIQLGTEYPARLFARNPPPSQGQLTTTSGNVTITGAQVQNPSAFRGNPNQTLLGVDHATNLIEYRSNYANFNDAPEATVLEHTLLYNQFGPDHDNTNLSVDDQQLVNNGTNSINLVLFEGDIQANGLATTVDVEALDGPTASVPIENTSGSTFNITLPTNSPSIWESNDTIGTTFDSGEPNARATRSGEEEVTITVDDSVAESWELQVKRVGTNSSGTTDALSTIEKIDPRGPLVNISSFDDPVNAGNDINIVGSVSSVGNNSVNRTGTPIQKIRAEPENHSNALLLDVSPDNTTATGRNFTFDTNDPNSTVDPIQTDGTWSGQETIIIRAQDASGRWSEVDKARIVVTVN